MRLADRLLAPVERLVAALTDPVRCARAVVGVLAAYVAVWTLYGAIAKGSQDIHFDMAELVAWARAPAWGYSKHPPLAAWLAGGWFEIFPAADWAFYLLAITVAAAAMLLAWWLFARYLEGEKRVLALAMLTLIPFFNFHALKLNPNTVLLPLWAVTTLWFIRSYESRSRIDAALAGLGAAACMMGKYWSIFLLAGAVDYDCGRCGGARAACRLVVRERFSAVLLCDRGAWRAIVGVGVNEANGIFGGRCRICGRTCNHFIFRGEGASRRATGYFVAVRAGAAARVGGVLGAAVAAGIGGAVFRYPNQFALDHVGLDAFAGGVVGVAAYYGDADRDCEGRRGRDPVAVGRARGIAARRAGDSRGQGFAAGRARQVAGGARRANLARSHGPAIAIYRRRCRSYLCGGVLFAGTAAGVPGAQPDHFAVGQSERSNARGRCALVSVGRCSVRSDD
jgi:Dolichyl-phosphate-mannose-protein mannosyltransferase